MSLYHKYKHLDDEGKYWIAEGIIQQILNPPHMRINRDLSSKILHTASEFICRKRIAQGEDVIFMTADEALARASLVHAFLQDWSNLENNEPLRNLVAEQNLT